MKYTIFKLAYNMLSYEYNIRCYKGVTKKILELKQARPGCRTEIFRTEKKSQKSNNRKNSKKGF